MNNICSGCILAAHERGMNNICAFCREPIPEGPTASLALVQKRVDAGDARAMNSLGEKYDFGQLGLQQDKSRAAELYREAANLGSVEAHTNLGFFYSNGKGGVEKDETKAVYHFEIAAKAGHSKARFNLGAMEARNSYFVRALKHWMIAAKTGDEDSLMNIKICHKKGFATKEDYSLALIGYQQAVEETKSDQRDKATVYFRGQSGSG